MFNGVYISIDCKCCGKETEFIVGADYDGDEDGIYTVSAIEESDQKNNVCSCDRNGDCWDENWDEMREELLEIRRQI